MGKSIWAAGLAVLLALAGGRLAAGDKDDKDNMPPAGFKALFNGKDLTGWQGVVTMKQRKELSADKLKDLQEKQNKRVLPHWKVEDGVLHYDGKGDSLQTTKDYGNFELYVDWKILPKGDSGIYLRGQPQVQIWEETDKAAQKNGQFIGSGGLYNNQKHARDPLVVADNPTGKWNTFFIRMIGDKVTVKLNGKTVVGDTPLENYWYRGQPLPTTGPIELQHHGNSLWFNNIYIKELP
jgi:hypothetical protein